MSLIRRVTPEHPVPSVKPEADPFRWFLRWDPFREMTPSWFGAPPVDTTFMPPFEVKEKKDDTYYAFERCFGSFLRTFTLPDGFDNEHVFAELKDGVLTVVVYKKPI